MDTLPAMWIKLILNGLGDKCVLFKQFNFWLTNHVSSLVKFRDLLTGISSTSSCYGYHHILARQCGTSTFTSPASQVMEGRQTDTHNNMVHACVTCVTVHTVVKNLQIAVQCPKWSRMSVLWSHCYKCAALLWSSPIHRLEEREEWSFWDDK